MSATTGGGTYTLLVELDADAHITFGAAGDRRLDAGGYAYTGSALGPGGFARLDRHRAVATGRRAVRHWHVDHLLGHPQAAVVGDVRSAGLDAECAVARAVDAEPVAGVGASDCDCGSHLAHAPEPAALARAARRAHARVANGLGD